MGFWALLVGAGCGGRYEVIDGSAGATSTSAGASVVVGRAGAPSVAVTQPGNPAGAPSFGGSFGFGGAEPVPLGGSFGVAGAPVMLIGGLSEPCYADGRCNPGLLCESNALCLPIRGDGAASVCDGLGTRVIDVSSAVLENFEQATIAPQWSAFADLGAPGVDAADNKLAVVITKPGAANTAYGGRYFGMGANPASISPGFGVGAILNVAIDPRSGVYCADISAFDGVSFWAKTGVSDSVLDVEFVLPSTNLVSNSGGGDCVTGCYNHPYKRVALTGTWAQYAVRFVEADNGSANVLNLIQEIGWLSPDSDWDFSLDEITFYKGIPPTGPVVVAPVHPK